MSQQSVLARLDEMKASGPSPSQSSVQSSSGICIKQEYFEDQLLMTVKTESESPPNEHNIMQSIKVEVKEEEHDEDDKDCACPECVVKQELDFDEGGEQMDTDRDVKIGLPHSTSECSRSTPIGSSSVPPPPPVTNSTTIQANIKVEIKESSTVQLCECVKKEEEDGTSNEQSVQHFKCDKKEEEDGGEYVMECDCEDCEICRVKVEMKEELDQSGETELGGNSGETCQGFTRIKQEEEDGEGEGEKPRKIQRLDRVFGNVPVGSPSPNDISTNVECPDDQMSTSFITPTTIEYHTKPSQPVTFPLPTPLVTPTQPSSSSSSSPAVNEPLRAELLNGVPRMDNVFDVPQESDREQVDEDNSTLNRVHNIEQDFEEYDEQDGDETIEQRQDTSAGDEQPVPAENFVKRIEPDEFGNRFLCDYQTCGKLMKTKQHLIDHIRTHTGEKPFRCTVAGCDQAFSQNSHLKAHLNTHSGTRPFVCNWPSCEARFAQKTHLTVHLRTHTGERPFQCGQCDVTFTQHSNLVTHLRTHTGERPFHCDQCNAAFTRHGDLVTHLRTHTGSRPFVCTWPECGQAFTQSSHLKTHSLVHSNERQFSCDVRGCTKVYKRKGALLRHQKAKHH